MRYRGEDVHAGDVLARAGERLRCPGSPRSRPRASARSPSTAARGCTCSSRASELLPLGAPPEPGRIHESNGLMVRLLAERAGAEVTSTAASSPDDRAATLEAVERGLAGDVLVVSGGVSVGPHDHVKPAFEACGVEEVLWRVRIKPGKPMWFGRRGEHARLRAAGQPAVEHRLLLRVHRAGAAAPAGRARRGAAARARPPRRARRGRPTGARRS